MIEKLDRYKHHSIILMVQVYHVTHLHQLENIMNMISKCVIMIIHLNYFLTSQVTASEIRIDDILLENKKELETLLITIQCYYKSIYVIINQLPKKNVFT